MSYRFTPIALAIASLASVTSTTVFAENELGTTIVTATRQAQRADEVMANVTVIERQEIQQAGANTLADLLSRTPGIQMSRTGGPGADENLYIRGTNSNHVLVLVDGMPMGSATLGTTTLNMLPLSQVERIEVLRGPASALYGSDAIGGVINIFTRPDAQGTQLSAGFGNRDTYSTSLSHAGKTENWRYSARISNTASDGINNVINKKSSSFNLDNDGYRTQNISLNAAYTVSSRTEIGAGYFEMDGKNKYDSYAFDPATYKSLYPNRDYYTTHKTRGLNVYAKTKLTDNWDSQFRVSQSVDESKESETTTVGSPASSFKTEQTQYSWQNDVTLPLGKALVLLEQLKQTVSGTTAYTLTERTIDSASFGWNAKIDQHHLQLNYRNDHNSQFGDHHTETAAYGYDLNANWRASASYGTAFKAPTFNALYFPYIAGTGVGNPNLKPESSTNREANLRYDDGANYAQLTYFKQDVDNLIDWAPLVGDPFYTYTPTNLNKAQIKGWESSAGWKYLDWQLSGTLTVQDPEDASTHKQLARRAKQFGSVRLAHQYGPWNYAVELVANGMRYNDVKNTQPMGGYTLTNLSAEYRLDRQTQLFARVDNLFNRNYELARSYNTIYGVPGSMFFVGIRYTPQ